MQIIEWIKDNPVMVGFVCVVVVGLLGGPKKLMEKFRSFTSKLPDLTPGPPTEHDAVDAAKLLCEFLPAGPAEELCKIVSPHLLVKQHE